MISSERRGSTLWVRLNRPRELNTISPQVVAELDAVLAEAERDRALTALVLTGTGRAFCAGADLKFLNGLPEDDRPAAGDIFLKSILAVMDRLEAFPRPTIAAINGIATGGGMELLLCCDLVYCAETSRLGDGHANFGLIPGGGGSVRLPRKIGPTLAKYLFFTGDLLPAADFVGTGLVTGVVPDADLESTVAALCDRLATKSPIALARIKRLANDALEQPKPQGMSAERAMNELHSNSFDSREGIAAFNEKRTPQFQGR